MADINDRLDRLQRREEFDRFGRPLRPAPAEDPVRAGVTRPAGVDDRLGEVLDAVAAVVRRHPGLSVMVAIADGRAGRPVVRVTERDGSVETGVVVAGPAGPHAVGPAASAQAAAVPTASAPVRADVVPAGDPVFEPGSRELPRSPAYGSVARENAVPAGDPVFEPAGRDLARDLPGARDVPGAHERAADRELAEQRERAARELATSRNLPPRPYRDETGPYGNETGPYGNGTGPYREEAANQNRAPDGRHAAHDENAGFSGSSWHNALWSRDRPRPGDPPMSEPDRLRLVPDEADQGGIALPEDTSEVVSRLAQMLRDNPTLASNWGREAPE